MPKKKKKKEKLVQKCPRCGNKISAIAGTVDSKCKNCGYKDGCCGS